MQAQLAVTLALDEHPVVAPPGQELAARHRGVEHAAVVVRGVVVEGVEVHTRVPVQRHVRRVGLHERGALEGGDLPQRRAQTGQGLPVGDVRPQGAGELVPADGTPGEGQEREDPFGGGRQPHVLVADPAREPADEIQVCRPRGHRHVERHSPPFPPDLPQRVRLFEEVAGPHGTGKGGATVGLNAHGSR